MTGSVQTAAQLACIDIYTNKANFDSIVTVNEDNVGIKRYGNQVYIVPEGTWDKQGWADDADILTFDHPDFGPIHAGFYKNVPALILQIVEQLQPGDEIYVSGHSRGAPIACYIGGELKLAGYVVKQAVLFACPRPGYQQFATWMQTNILGVSFRNASSQFALIGDIVPLLPFLPFVEAYPHVMIDSPPGGFADVDDADWHAGILYNIGVSNYQMAG